MVSKVGMITALPKHQHKKQYDDINMKAIEIIQIILFFGLGIALTPVVGKFMAKVYKGERTFLHPIFLPVEKLIYRLTGIDPNEEMTWLRYFWAVLLFAFV